MRIKEPFILCEEGKNITLLDDGFYLLEYVPFDKDYICRVHLNNNGEVVERFFSASKNNMMKDGVPCFEDLKYSYVCSSAAYKEYNKEALISLLDEKKIDENDYNAACETINLIKDEIENSSNFIFNLDYKKYIF